MLSFEIVNDELILIYEPDNGLAGVVESVKRPDGLVISKTFKVSRNQIRESEDCYDECIRFCIGNVVNDYIKLDCNVIMTNHTFYFSKSIELERKYFVASRNISILRKIDRIVDSDVYFVNNEFEEDDKGDCHIPIVLYKRLIKTFPNTYELNRYADKRIAMIIDDFMPKADKYDELYEKYLTRKAKNNHVITGQEKTQINNAIKCEQFNIALEELKALIVNDNVPETIWQDKIEPILLLLYPQYVFSTREFKLKGVDNYNKRPDYILVDANGYIDIMEIKKPSVKVISNRPSYRNNYYPSRALSGTVQQVEKYILCLTDSKVTQERFYKELSGQLKNGVTPQAINPRGLILLGRSNDFNKQQKNDFELIRRQYKNIADIMTYDDLIDRFERIIDSIKLN